MIEQGQNIDKRPRVRDRNGKPQSKRNALRAWTTALDKIGVDANLHSLRHSFISGTLSGTRRSCSCPTSSAIRGSPRPRRTTPASVAANGSGSSRYGSCSNDGRRSGLARALYRHLDSAPDGGGRGCGRGGGARLRDRLRRYPGRRLAGRRRCWDLHRLDLGSSLLPSSREGTAARNRLLAAGHVLPRTARRRLSVRGLGARGRRRQLGAILGHSTRLADADDPAALRRQRSSDAVGTLALLPADMLLQRRVRNRVTMRHLTPADPLP